MISKLPDAIEIGYSRSRLLPLIGLGALMTLIGASIAFELLPYSGIGGHHGVIGAVGIAVFGLVTAKFVWGGSPWGNRWSLSAATASAICALRTSSSSGTP